MTTPSPTSPQAPESPQAPHSRGPRSRYDLDRTALAALLDGEPRYRVDQVWEGLHTHGGDPEEWTNLPKALRSRLNDELPPPLIPMRHTRSDAGRTAKWLWGLADGNSVETVLMEYPDRVTVCVSTQAGCAMGCGFCATGQMGFRRHLSAGEIVEQVVRARTEAAPRRVANVVFMGMGEPLANYDGTWAAVTRIHDDLGISARHLTLSTVGIVPGIRRLTHETLPVNLAVSLHAATDPLRDELVPINRRYPIADLMEVCRQYVHTRRRRLSFEWALIRDVNDTPAQADALTDLARDLRAHVNLIPLNPTPGYGVPGSPPKRVAAFRDRLIRSGVNATVRHNRGNDISAACGQLAVPAAPDAPPGRQPDGSSPRGRPVSVTTRARGR